MKSHASDIHNFFIKSLSLLFISYTYFYLLFIIDYCYLLSGEHITYVTCVFIRLLNKLTVRIQIKEKRASIYFVHYYVKCREKI